MNRFEQKITNRFRGPNKKDMSSIDPADSPDNPPIINLTTPPTGITIGTQTDSNSNLGQGIKPHNPYILKNPFDNTTIENSPDYLLNLHKVLGEAFIAEAIKTDSTSNKIRRLIELQDWTAFKNLSHYWYSLRKELSVNPNGCILYDGKLYIPPQPRKTVIDSVHKTHPGQARMIYLGQIMWYPQIHQDIVALAQRCKQCTRTGKNLKSIIPKNKHETYNHYPNQTEKSKWTSQAQ